MRAKPNLLLCLAYLVQDLAISKHLTHNCGVDELNSGELAN
jgi:hypothetical protein